jgi:hypothetical protein
VPPVQHTPPIADHSVLNIISPKVIATAPPAAVVCLVIVNVVGSSGRLTLNDCRTLGEADASNVIRSIAHAKLSTGILELFHAVESGICISQVPRGGRICVSYAFPRPKGRFSIYTAGNWRH